MYRRILVAFDGSKESRVAVDECSHLMQVSEREIHLVCVLKGGFMFMADLVRAMSARVTLDFIAVSSYGARTSSSGEVRLLKDLDSTLEGRDVIIVEDIVDTGLTLSYLQDILRARPELAGRIAHGRTAVAAAARLVEQQLAVLRP